MTSRPAGIGSHGSQRALSQVWLTPRWVIGALGPFDLDPCAAPTPRPWPTARVHYTAPAEDGLLLPWSGRIWLNPPYDALPAWLGRLVEHGAGTALLFARTETETFWRLIWREATALVFLRGRLTFHRPDGTLPGANSGAPSVLVAYGHEDADRLHAYSCSGETGAFVPLSAAGHGLLFVLGTRPAPREEGPTWRAVVWECLEALGGTASLQALYKALSDHPKARSNPHYKEKVRQTLGRGQVTRLGGGLYQLPLPLRPEGA